MPGTWAWSEVAKRQDAMLQQDFVFPCGSCLDVACRSTAEWNLEFAAKQEREEQRGADAKSILMKHPAGEVFWMRLFCTKTSRMHMPQGIGIRLPGMLQLARPGPDSDSEDDAAAIMKMRGRAEDVNLASSDEDAVQHSMPSMQG